MNETVQKISDLYQFFGLNDKNCTFFIEKVESKRSKEQKAQLRWLNTLANVMQTLLIKLKRREINGAGECALHTVELLRTIISHNRFDNIDQLIIFITAIGKLLIAAQPSQLTIGSMVRRILYMIRNEAFLQVRNQEDNKFMKATNKKIIYPKQTILPNNTILSPPELSHSTSLKSTLANLLDNDDNDNAEHVMHKDDVLHKIKPLVIEEINELAEEIKAVSHSICDQAEDYIYAKEVIMTFGISKTVVGFLASAAQFRDFEVIVAQSGPGYEGNKQAKLLAEKNINCTVIPDSAVFAMMKNVTKVIINTHAVLANGGLIAYTGAHNILLAAKYHSVPCIVLTGLHKLSPLYAFDDDTFNQQNPPGQVLPFDQSMHEYSNQSCTIENPAYDYVPPELITLFITNNGDHSPFYIYRLLSEYFDNTDYSLD